MIKVSVVDDEKLVRRGIIGLIDWEKYGMKVIGDFGSGEDAVAFLTKEKVDLLFADMEMPGLSGIRFLETVKNIRPDIRIVVLTMHQEFELIQRALRIGILDYITKAQIEEENVDNLMNGIRKRYLETMRHTRSIDRRIAGHEIYLWLLDERERMTDAAFVLKQNRFSFEEFTENSFLFPVECNIIRLKALIEDFAPVRSTLLELKQIANVPYNQLEEILQTAVSARLFEDRCQGCFFYTYLYPELLEAKPGPSREEILELCLKMEFMLSEDSYSAGMEKIRHAALSKEERIAVFYRFNLYWSQLSGKDFTKYFEEAGGFEWWYQWKEWFDEIRSRVKKKIGGSNEEIAAMEAVHKAVNYIREHMDREISLEELLRLTGMSKSHFSKNFKKLTGKTFVTYLNDLRIEAAKRYLRETTQPVYWIAGQVGYTDEHYFRRIFRERTGENPKQYRDNNEKQN